MSVEMDAVSIGCADRAQISEAPGSSLSQGRV